MSGTRRQTLTVLSFAVTLALAVTVVLFWMASDAGASPPAQGPETPLFINYQGYLTDDSGQPTSGNLSMTFTIWNQASGGTNLWQEADKPVAVTNGLFNTVLGDQTALSTGVFANAQLWLGVQVGADPEMTPRQRLVSAPYALGARDADTLDGSHANAFWSVTGNGGTQYGTHFVGTTDAVSLTLAVNGEAALRLEPHATSPNVIGGYSGNSVTAGVYGATIGGGGSGIYPNRVTANHGTVGGGRQNTASEYAIVGGGYHNTAGGHYATVGGGYYDTASGNRATVGGGQNNTASGGYATVGGGLGNTASGGYATVGGGDSNTAQGDYSFAAGRRAQANNQGCFVWGDSNNSDVECNTDNRWVARASGGVWFWTNSGATVGARLAASGTSWGAVSARQLKENLVLVDGQELLARLAENPITTWNYKAQDPSIRHIGPMAEDFNALLDDLGGEGEGYINTLDADGVALAAIQALYQRIQALEAENAELEARLAALEALMAGKEGP